MYFLLKDGGYSSQRMLGFLPEGPIRFLMTSLPQGLGVKSCKDASRGVEVPTYWTYLDQMGPSKSR